MLFSRHFFEYVLNKHIVEDFENLQTTKPHTKGRKLQKIYSKSKDLYLSLSYFWMFFKMYVKEFPSFFLNFYPN